MKVSVCLLTYNRAGRLAATIDSLLAQTLPDFELIIRDDCSSDGTEAICREYARRDGRIRYIRSETNLGMPGNLNAALQAACGEYLANLHDGDLYRRDCLAQWAAALDANPSAGFVFNAYQTVQNDGTLRIYREDYPALVKGEIIGRRLLSRWDSCVFGTVMARRAAYEQVGWFDPQFGNYSDVDMWLRLARAYDVCYVNEPLIDLMPRDPTRFYAFVHWRVWFWLVGIHTSNLRRYRPVLPGLTGELGRRLGARARAFFLYNLLICVKHRRWDRVEEALAICRDADDFVLRSLGRLSPGSGRLPDWYDPSYWNYMRLDGVKPGVKNR